MDIPTNLYQLKLFCCVVEHRSYSAAAEHLLISQPSLSMQIKTLSNKLGVTLLVRKGNKIELTEAGQFVYQYAVGILELDNKMKKTIKALSEGMSGNISIGSNRLIGQFTLSDLILKFMQHVPDVEISVAYDNSDQILNHVMDGKFDVGFVALSEEYEISSLLHRKLIAEDHWILISTANNPWFSKNKTIQEVVQGAPLIGSLAKTTYGKILEKELHRLRITHKSFLLRLDDIQSIKSAVLSKLGIAFVPFRSVQKELKNGELVHFATYDHPALYYYLVTRKSHQITPTLNNFINYIVQESLDL